MEFTIRGVESEDIQILSLLYQRSVLHAEKKVYNHEKLITWASVVEDAGFFDFVTQPMSLVAIEKNTIIGFGSIKNDGHIILLYKDAWKKKAEFGNDLLKKLLEWGKKNNIRYFQTEASEFTKGLFEKFGFKTVEIEQVVRNGLVFMHYKMVLDFVRKSNI